MARRTQPPLWRACTRAAANEPATAAPALRPRCLALAQCSSQRTWPAHACRALPHILPPAAGAFDVPEQAAHAHDIGALCSGKARPEALNFPLADYEAMLPMLHSLPHVGAGGAHNNGLLPWLLGCRAGELQRRPTGPLARSLPRMTAALMHALSTFLESDPKDPSAVTQLGKLSDQRFDPPTAQHWHLHLDAELLINSLRSCTHHPSAGPDCVGTAQLRPAADGAAPRRQQRPPVQLALGALRLGQGVGG